MLKINYEYLIMYYSLVLYEKFIINILKYIRKTKKPIDVTVFID